MSLSVSELKAMAASYVADIARELAPEGKLSGAYWIGKSPLRSDRHSGSFCVWVKGPAAGAWKDFSAGDKGDLVDLVAEVKYGGRSREARGEAIQWLKRRIGLADSAPAEISRAKNEAMRRRREVEEAELREAERKARRCFDMWASGSPLGGTRGEVYLLSRGVAAAEIPNKSATFRFIPALDYWKGGAAPHCGPAIVGRYRDARGAFPAVHATWLTADGSAKAALDPAKLSYGPYKGCFLPIGMGETGKEVWEEGCPGGPVQVSEGPEDAWSLALARPDIRTWAAGSLSNIGNLPCPPAVSAFLVVRQNDWKTPAAVAAFERAIAALKRHGRPVVEIGTGVGKDPNDQLRGLF